MISENTSPLIKIIECPRDAMQGWKEWIPSDVKINYINSLLNIGFDTIDVGSFVSEKAIPQMKDTDIVLNSIDMSDTDTKLLAIVANKRGADQAITFKNISYLGFPFSISETFQKRNTNKSIEEAFDTVKEMQEIVSRSGKMLVIYISMGFGNPYGDVYNEDIVLKWVSKMAALDIKIISMADTVGVATAPQVSSILSKLIPSYKNIEIGVHLHASVSQQQEKIMSALSAGCVRFDGALKGIGGCPMANDDLVGNINTENIITILENQNIPLLINKEALAESLILASNIFHTNHI